MKGWAKRIKFGLVSLGIDNYEVGVGIFVLERPKQMRFRIEFQSVVVSGNGVYV